MQFIITDEFGRKEINFSGLIKHYWERRKILIILSFVMSALMVTYTFFLKSEYQSNIKLLIEDESSAGNSLGQFEGIASLAGVDLSTSAGLSPEVYEDIIRSLRFQDRLLDTEIQFSTYESSSLREYYEKYYSPSLLGIIVKKIKSILGSEQQVEYENLYEGVIRIPKDEMYQYEDLNERLGIEILDNGTFIIRFQFSDPLVSAGIVKKASELIQEMIKKYQTEKIRNNLSYINQSYELQKANRQKAQRNLADFVSQNYNLSSPYFQTQLDQLRSELNLQNDLFLSIAKKREETTLSLQNQTPSFSELDSILIPNEKVYPKRIKFLIIGLFLGLFFGIVYLTTEIIIQQVRDSIS